MVLDSRRLVTENVASPEDLDVQRRELSQRVLTSPRCLRLLAFGPASGEGGETFAALMRALENLGHAVLVVSWPLGGSKHETERAQSHAGAAADPETTLPGASVLGPYFRHFKPGIILCAGGLHFSPREAQRLKAEGYVLVGLDISRSATGQGRRNPVLPPVEAVGNFDLFGVASPAVLASYRQAGLVNTVLFPLAADLSRVCANLTSAPDLAADLVVLGDAGQGSERMNLMAEAIRSVPQARLYGRGWPPHVGQESVHGVRRLQALREAQILALFAPPGQDPFSDRDLFDAVGQGALVAIPFGSGTAVGSHHVADGGEDQDQGVGESPLLEVSNPLADGVWQQSEGDAWHPFAVGTEVIGYLSPADLAAQVLALKANPARREAMRRAAFARLADEHLFEHRWLAFLAELEARANTAPSPLPEERARVCRQVLASAGSRKRRLLISGFYGGGNAGDELILMSLREALARPGDPYEFVVAAYDADAVKATHGLVAFPRTDLPRAQGEAVAATALIQGGGGLWHDYTFAPAGSLLGMFTETQSAITGYSKLPLLARVFDRPVHVFGLGVGPLTDPDACAYTRFLARQVQSLAVRDPASRDLLTDIDGWDRPVELWPDPVFALNLGQPARPANDKHPEKEVVIGLNLRPWQTDAGQDLARRLAAALNGLAAERRVRLLGIPLQQPGDAQVIADVFDQLDEGVERRLLGFPPGDPLAVIAAIQGCDYLIGMRYHACLLAYRLGVPALGLAYDPKVAALFDQLGRPGAALPLGVDPEALRLRLKDLVAMDADERQRCAGRVRELEAQARAGLAGLRARLDVAVPVAAPILVMGSPSPSLPREELAARLRRAEVGLKQTEKRHADLVGKLEQAEQLNKALVSKLEIAKTEQERLTAQVSTLAAAYQEVMFSKSWRVTAPLRAAMEATAHARRQLRMRLDATRVLMGARSKAPGPETGRIEDSSSQPQPVPPPAPAPIVLPEPPRRLADLRLAAILDTFSLSCFEPECQIITFRPDNWREVLTATPPHLLFVESAWNGNDGAWQYRVARYAAPPGRELPELVTWCRAQGIPTVFWNKEDPPHFDDFIDTARQFDVILTTDSHCIPRYRELCGHDQVYALPFAAQPRLHNPVQTEERNHRLCFAGTWYGDRFDARRAGMEALLRPALAFELDIYDRMHGAVGPGSEAYRFPEDYVPHIRGRLTYPEMVAAYRRYRAFLNVNSVTDSPTMFSRRVFELLACGTPVVSTESAGIRALFPDIVPIVTSSEEAQAAFRELLGDDEHWRRRSALGIRRVMAGHCYHHRLAQLCGLLGWDLPADKTADASLTLVVLPGPKPEITALQVLGQSLLPLSILLLANGQEAGLHQALIQSGAKNVRVIERPSLALTDLGGREDATLAFIDGRHSYGPGYLMDACQALDYSGAKVTGLRAHYVFREGVVRYDDTLGGPHFMATDLLGVGLVCRAGALPAQVMDRAFDARTLILDQPAYARGPSEFLAGAVLDWSDSRLGSVILEPYNGDAEVWPPGSSANDPDAGTAAMGGR